MTRRSTGLLLALALFAPGCDGWGFGAGAGAAYEPPPPTRVSVVVAPPEDPRVGDHAWDITATPTGPGRYVRSFRMYHSQSPQGAAVELGFSCNAADEGYDVTVAFVGAWRGPVYPDNPWDAASPEPLYVRHPEPLVGQVACVEGQVSELRFDDVTPWGPFEPGVVDVAVAATPSAPDLHSVWDVQRRVGADAIYAARLPVDGGVGGAEHPCDASPGVTDGQVSATFVGLYADPLSLYAPFVGLFDGYGSTAPPDALPVFDPGTLEADVTCAEGAAVSVDYEVVLAAPVAAGLTFAGLECEPALRCDTAASARLEWACSGPAGQGAPTLYLGEVALDCGDGPEPLDVDTLADVATVEVDGRARASVSVPVRIFDGHGCALTAVATAEPAAATGRWVVDGELPDPKAPASNVVSYPLARWALDLGEGCVDAALGDPGLEAVYSHQRGASTALPHAFPGAPAGG